MNPLKFYFNYKVITNIYINWEKNPIIYHCDFTLMYIILLIHILIYFNTLNKNRKNLDFDHNHAGIAVYSKYHNFINFVLNTITFMRDNTF